MQHYKTVGGMLSAALAERGEKDSDGNPIIATEQPMNDEEYQRHREEVIRNKTENFKIQNPTLEVGTTFRIKNGVFKGEIYTVKKLTPEHAFDVVCAGERLDVMCFNSAQLTEYGYTVLEAAPVKAAPFVPVSEPRPQTLFSI